MCRKKNYLQYWAIFFQSFRLPTRNLTILLKALYITAKLMTDSEKVARRKCRFSLKTKSELNTSTFVWVTFIYANNFFWSYNSTCSVFWSSFFLFISLVLLKRQLVLAHCKTDVTVSTSGLSTCVIWFCDFDYIDSSLWPIIILTMF